MKKAFFLCLSLFAIALFSCSKDGESPAPSYESSGDLLADGRSFGSSDISGGSGGDNSIPAGQITAGEWNDFDNWEFWQGLQADEIYGGFQQYWGFYPVNRYSVQVVDGSGKPRADVSVAVMGSGSKLVWEARTDNFGKAEVFEGLFDNNGQTNLIIVDGSQIVNNPSPTGINQVVLPQGTSVLNHADIAFIVDATGSMGDEITYLQAELSDVISRAKSGGQGLNLRSASVFYRDEGDDYVTKLSPFTTDIGLTQDFVNDNVAGGGGDFPEAVDQALDVAINQLDWSENALTRIAFLVLDAPPHHEQRQLTMLKGAIQEAAKKGIKVIPITASGIDKETEFLMRYLALSTNGTYVFITNHSGIGNEHLEPTVGEYEVEFLNDLMVRLIKKYSEKH
jgi:hypothetical protein